MSQQNVDEHAVNAAGEAVINLLGELSQRLADAMTTAYEAREAALVVNNGYTYSVCQLYYRVHQLRKEVQAVYREVCS